MITKESFINLIEDYQNWTKKIDNLQDAFGKYISLYETFIFDYPDGLFNELLSAYFNEEGVDWITWWLYERPDDDDEKYQAWDENGDPIPTETLDNLWDIVKKYTI